ncbi:polyketide synthase [bacterium]|nr:polyketide synthase [bacterium]
MHEGVAIIGMACRFPEADDYREFWANLAIGKISIRQMTTTPASGNEDRIPGKWGGFISGAAHFDPLFFGISPKEARYIDPQQRLMLELAWECIEDAGYPPSRLAGSNTGVYIGACNFDYRELLIKNGLNNAHSVAGTLNTFIPNRISYFFNLHGPSIHIDTACASSLFAVEQGVRSVRSGECGMALVGGVNLLLSETQYTSFSKAGMLSPTHTCRTFDENADGYVRGEGGGMLLLKPLSKAIADGDPIWAIIKGAAVNHGGRAKGLISPNAFSQSQVIAEAWRQADVTAESISHIETHGTGTPLGDPLEIHGLTRAFSQIRQEDSGKTAFCGLSSVKPSIGHLESASGIAGIIKVILSMRAQQLPGVQNFKTLNPKIKLEDSPFYILSKPLIPWEPPINKSGTPYPRRAGVSSFGLGGANAHVALEEWEPDTIHSPAPNEPLAFPFSAKTQERLSETVAKFIDYLDKIQSQKHAISLRDIAYTLQVGRENMDYRLGVIAQSATELQVALTKFLSNEPSNTTFTGQINKETHPEIENQAPRSERVEEWIKNKNLPPLLRLWTNGYEPDWTRFYSIQPKRQNLPCYSFAPTPYWVPDAAQ